MIETAYSVLGISHDATFDEIKSAWRVKAREWHPDRSGGDTTMFIKMQKAYAEIEDVPSRRLYDKRLALEHETCPQCSGNGRIYKQKGFTERVGKLCATCKGSGVA